MEKIKNQIWNWIHTESKLPKKNQLFIVFLIGILLLVIAIPVSPSEQEMETEEFGMDKQNSRETEEISQSRSNTLEEYEAYLEKRVASALEYVEGVGKAEVVITLKSSSQKVVEKDRSSDSRTTDEEDSAGGTRTENSRLTEQKSIYTQTENGSQIPYVSKELTPEIEGVMVIAQGGDNAVVIQNITGAIQALFGIDAHKIKIMKRIDT